MTLNHSLNCFLNSISQVPTALFGEVGTENTQRAEFGLWACPAERKQFEALHGTHKGVSIPVNAFGEEINKPVTENQAFVVCDLADDGLPFLACGSRQFRYLPFSTAQHLAHCPSWAIKGEGD